MACHYGRLQRRRAIATTRRRAKKGDNHLGVRSRCAACATEHLSLQARRLFSHGRSSSARNGKFRFGRSTSLHQLSAPPYSERSLAISSPPKGRLRPARTTFALSSISRNPIRNPAIWGVKLMSAVPKFHIVSAERLAEESSAPPGVRTIHFSLLPHTPPTPAPA